MGARYAIDGSQACALIKDHRLSVYQGLVFVVFLLFQNFYMASTAEVKNIPVPIQARHAQILSLGEDALFARGILFWLQSFDSQSGKMINYDAFNYEHLMAWFALAESLDPASQYTLLTASGIFIETKNQNQVRQVIAYVHKQFLKAPQTRWRWQLSVVMVAKHRLKDLALAQVLARDLRLYTKGVDLPAWVRDIEHLILEEQGEIEAAIMVIDSLLAEGLIQDAHEIRFLTEKLQALAERKQP